MLTQSVFLSTSSPYTLYSLPEVGMQSVCQIVTEFQIFIVSECILNVKKSVFCGKLAVSSHTTRYVSVLQTVWREYGIKHQRVQGNVLFEIELV